MPLIVKWNAFGRSSVKRKTNILCAPGFQLGFYISLFASLRLLSLCFCVVSLAYHHSCFWLCQYRSEKHKQNGKRLQVETEYLVVHSIRGSDRCERQKYKASSHSHITSNTVYSHWSSVPTYQYSHSFRVSQRYEKLMNFWYHNNSQT